MADISKITTLNGTTYNIKDATARNSIPAAASANPLMDGTAAVGTSIKYAREDHRHPSDTTKYTINNYGQGTTDLSIRPLIAFSRANRLAFLPADQIIIETTIDGGATWVSGGYSDSAKKSLFATRGTNIAIPLLNGAKSTKCGVRITITGMKYNVPSGTAETGKYAYWNSTYIQSQERYSNLREMWFWLSSNTDAIRVQVYRATGANPNNWVTDFDTDFPLTGWSGSDWIRLSGNTFGGGTNQTGNYWNWRIIFWSRMHDGDTTFRSATQQSIAGIAGYGDNVWGMPNGMMKEDHLYTWDADMNATFPARVNATSFNGYTIASNVPANAKFTDTTYESKAAVSGGTDVSLVTTGEKYTWNQKGSGTITGIKMNGASKGTSGVVDLGTVITAHQDISGKADKSATVSTVTYDSTNKKLTKTINGTTSDIVSVATLKTALSLAKGDVGLGNVENKSSATIRGELTKANVTNALGYTPPTSDTNTHRPIQINGTEILGNNTTALNLKAGNNVSVTNSSGTVTIAATQPKVSIASSAPSTASSGDIWFKIVS